MLPTPGCSDRDRFLDEYTIAVQLAARVVSRLASVTGTRQKMAYRALAAEMEAAKVRVEDARRAYEQHVRDHQCDVIHGVEPDD
jgi:IS1 family transposase